MNICAKIKKISQKEPLFQLTKVLILTLSVALAVAPLLYILSMSFSSKNAILGGKVSFWPVDFTWEAYESVWKTSSFLHSLWFTVLLTIVSTLASMTMTVLCAYPLSKKNLPGRKFITTIIILTMYFSGGIIPDYILMQSLHIKNTPAVLVLPGLISVYNMIVIRSFFCSLPESLIESAKIDGASDFKVLWSIVLPLSLPALATVGLFYAVGRWNGFSDALIYITNPNYYPIQLKLYQIITAMTDVEIAINEGAAIASSTVSAENVKAACMVVALVPILLVYPRIQKYFLSGVTIGAVKG